MSRKLKIVSDKADVVPPPELPEFDAAPTRKCHAGWTAERQRKFIEHLALTGHVGEACALVGVSSSSVYRLRAPARRASPAPGMRRFGSRPPGSPRSPSTARSTGGWSASTRTARW